LVVLVEEQAENEMEAPPQLQLMVGAGPQRQVAWTEPLDQTTLAAVVVEAHSTIQVLGLMAATVARALWFSNTPIHLPSPTPVVVSPIRPQLLVGLLLQHLLPERAMFLGVNDGTLRIS
jgi:hypothetical protein